MNDNHMTLPDHNDAFRVDRMFIAVRTLILARVRRVLAAIRFDSSSQSDVEVFGFVGLFGATQPAPDKLKRPRADPGAV